MMRWRSVRASLMATAIMAGAASAASAAEFVGNGDFSSSFTDWMTSATVGIGTQAAYYAGAGATGTYAGNWLAFGWDNQAGGSVSQTLSNLIVGQTYTLSFDYGAYGTNGALQALQVDVGTAATYTLSARALTNNLGWVMTHYTYTFVAHAASLALSFKDTSLTTTNADGFLDNVSVTGQMAVPGPVAGAGIPFLVMAGALWMRRRNRV